PERPSPPHALHYLELRNSGIYAAAAAPDSGHFALPREVSARHGRRSNENGGPRRSHQCSESDLVAAPGACPKLGPQPRGGKSANQRAFRGGQVDLGSSATNGRGSGTLGDRERKRLFPGSLRPRTLDRSVVESAKNFRRDTPLKSPRSAAHLNFCDRPLL